MRKICRTTKLMKRPGQIVLKCPVCKNRIAGIVDELKESCLADYSFICPVCGAKRHINREGIDFD